MADGTILIDTKIDTSGAQKGVDGLEDELNGIGKSSEKATEGLDGLWGQMFQADFFAGIASQALNAVGDALIEFVSGSIEAAADVKAANSQFSQTFKDMEKQATKSLEAISKQTGIAATRMQSSYTSVYAFSKSVGADSAEALDIANRAMLAAADSAAYYDKSIEEATETLQSFLKGNYENDAALGIAATETTRNAKANELYAMSFDKLSEAQKVDVLLAMVEAGNQASGALGQAAREADAWTNVTGEASEALRQLQAVIGDPIMESLTPIIQSITDAIYEMIEVSDSEKLANSMEDVSDSWADAEKQFAKTSKEIEKNALMADYYKGRLDELEKAGVQATGSQKEYANAVAHLNELYPDLNLQINEHTGLLDDDSRAQLDNLEVMKERALYVAMEERRTAALSAQSEAVIAVADAEYELMGIQSERAALESEIYEITGLSASELIKLYNAQMASNSALRYSNEVAPGVASSYAAAGYAASGLTLTQMDLAEQFLVLTGQESRLKTEIQKGNDAISEQDKKLQEWQNTLDIAEKSLGENADGQKKLATAAKDVTDELSKLRQEYDNARESARESIDSQIGYFEELSIESDKSASEIVANWEKQKEAFDNYSENLQKAVDMDLDEALVQQLSDGSEESMQILNALVNSTDTNVTEINEAFERMSESRETVASNMAEIQTEMSSKLDELADTVSESWGDMAGIVHGAISDMQSYIDELTGRTVYVDVVTRNRSAASSSSFTPAHPDIASTYSLEPQIPYLASGAVIPPNAPFMAVLGDQRHGTNIEAPLSTIQEAVDASLDARMGGMMEGFEATVSAINRLIETVESVDIGDTTIGEAANRYIHQMNIVRGGAM